MSGKVTIGVAIRDWLGTDTTAEGAVLPGGWACNQLGTLVVRTKDGASNAAVAMLREALNAENRSINHPFVSWLQPRLEQADATVKACKSEGMTRGVLHGNPNLEAMVLLLLLLLQLLLLLLVLLLLLLRVLLLVTLLVLLLVLPAARAVAHPVSPDAVAEARA